MKWRYEGRERQAICALGGGEGMEVGRINGSHHIYVKEGRIERLSIPVHGNQSLKIGLQRALMKIVPVNQDEL